MKILFSNCCNSTYHSEWSGYDKGIPPDEGTTCYYVCDKCEKACNLTQLTTCPNCNKDFKPHNRLQKYCDTNCRNKANYKKHKRISRGELIEWIKKNRHEAIYGVHRENVVNMDTLLEFLGE